jgi:hypothetical protein
LIKSSVIVGIIITTILLGSTQQIAETTTGFTDDDFTPNRADRAAINPDFDPDESCLYDAYQKRCIPGSEQPCPKPQFGNNEDNTCWPKTFINGEWKRQCPDDYHTTDGDETGQCYPNSSDCGEGAYVSEDGTSRFNYILLTGNDSPNPYDTCADPYDLCAHKPDHQGCNEWREWHSKYYPDN